MPQEQKFPAATAWIMGTDPLLGVRPEELVRLTGVHLTTAKRWKRAKRLRRWLALIVEICVEGELGPIARPWRGWRIRGEYLVSPEGWEFTFGEIRSIPFLHAQVRTYQMMQRTHLQADWVDERYVENPDRAPRVTCEECDTYRAIGREVSPRSRTPAHSCT